MIFKRIKRLGAIMMVWMCSVAAAPFDLPKENIPPMPPLEPMAVTTGGQRLLLNATDVQVSYQDSRLQTNHPGWWIINYPLNKIKGLEGQSNDQISQLLFSKPYQQLKNWYIKTDGISTPEPPAPTGPAPIELPPDPTFVVDTNHPQADDTNVGSADLPLKTISYAVSKAKAGDIIRVMPGIYRETVEIKQSGTADQPIRLEGVRDSKGNMPVITGNDPIPAGAWKPVEGLPGVWRTDAPGRLWGTLSVNGQTLIERSLPSDLKEGEYCLNRASLIYLNSPLDGTIDPQAGQSQLDQTWRTMKTGPDGMIDLARLDGAVAANAVYWLSTWLWVPPGQTEGLRWRDSQNPGPIYGRMEATTGDFGAGRMTGLPISVQVNKYRMWVNGKALPSVLRLTEDYNDVTEARPWRGGRRYTGRWDDFPLNDGWNHLVFELDTTAQPKQLKFNFVGGRRNPPFITSASAPRNKKMPPSGNAGTIVTEYQLLGPIPAGKPDRAIYVRLPGDQNPNEIIVNSATRGPTLVNVQGAFVQVRGFEIRHGAQSQQRAQVRLEEQGDLLEGCLIRDSEFAGVSFNANGDQTQSPIIIRNNWIINPGDVGISGVGNTSRLTEENQNETIPGYRRLLIEYNRIVNNNWSGYNTSWEAGSMKMFRLSGSVIRYNDLIGGTGGGIWLDSDHFNNRLEGNLSLNGYGFGIGVEASPGPNLVANTLCIDLRAGKHWSRAGILAWDSHRTWAVNNTIDGRSNPYKGWHNYVGTEGINISGLGGIRPDHPWYDESLKGDKRVMRGEAYVNNLMVGVNRAMPLTETLQKYGPPFAVNERNFTDRGEGAKRVASSIKFMDPSHGDYRLRSDNSLNRLGVRNSYSKLVTHDFNGLLRFQSDPQAVGAFRATAVEGSAPVIIELELVDGAMIRLKK